MLMFIYVDFLSKLSIKKLNYLNLNLQLYSGNFHMMFFTTIFMTRSSLCFLKKKRALWFTIMYFKYQTKM